MDTVGMSMGSVPLPKSHSAKIVVWDDLDLEQSETLKNATTLKIVKDILAGIFQLSNYTTQHQEGILLGLYTYAVQFAREQKLTAEQLSAFFSIVKQVHDVCVESPFGNLDETFTYFKDLLICHSVCCPPYSIKLFSINEIRKISHHVINTYFRHFKLYKYAFTPQVRLDLVLNYPGQSESDASQELEMEYVKEEQVESETEDSIEGFESSEKEMDFPKGLEKEEEFEAEKYLRNLITEFLQVEIDEIKLSVKEKLKQSEQLLNNKLEEVCSHDDVKKFSKKVGKSAKTPK